jgi:hypothetical protein
MRCTPGPITCEPARADPARRGGSNINKPADVANTAWWDNSAIRCVRLIDDALATIEI